MGHIVNATATRLGCFISWSDRWYSKKSYYSEFLHSMFRIRAYSYYLMTERHYDKKGIFFSHFELFKYIKTVYVFIYYYDGKLEQDFENYRLGLFRKHYFMPMNRDPETRRPYYLVTALKFLIVFDWIATLRNRSHFKFRMKKKDTKLTPEQMKIRKFQVIWKGRLIKYFRLARVAKLAAYAKHLSTYKKNKFKFLKWDHLNFALFVMIYEHMKRTMARTTLFSVPSRNSVLRRAYFCGAIVRRIRKACASKSVHLGWIFSLFTKFRKFSVSFFLIDNNTVSAKFLTRYIARKLRQGYPVKELLSPIKKELATLIIISAMSFKSYFSLAVQKYKGVAHSSRSHRSLFKVIISKTFSHYTLLKHKLLLKEKSFITIDLLFVYKLMNSYDYFSDSQKKSLSLDDLLDQTRLYTNKKTLINLGINYFKKKYIYICFFENKFFFKNIRYLLYPDLPGSYLFLRRDRDALFYESLYDYFFVNKVLILDLKREFGQNMSYSFFYLGKHMSRFIRFTYYCWNGRSHYKVLKVNFLRARAKIYSVGSNLIGYKMYLKGRFTRKQRAGHMWFSIGRTPLNTLSAFIDFAFFSIALKNSTITVRLWLYKEEDEINDFYYKIN